MPRYYGDQADPQEMSQLYGNPFYNPLIPGGAPDWVSGVQAIYSLMEGRKEKKKKEGQEAEDRMWQQALRELQMQSAKQVLEEGALGIEQKRREARDYRPPVPPEVDMMFKAFDAYRQQQYEKEQIKLRAKAEAEARGAGGKAEDKPSDYDKKVAQAKALFKAGRITEQEYNRILTGYTGEETEKERKATRNRIASETRKAVDAGISNKYHENQKDRETVKSALGVDLSMPAQYNISKRMIESDVAEDNDYDVVRKYEDLFKFYQEKLKPSMNLKELMASEFYKGLENELKAELVKWYRLKL